MGDRGRTPSSELSIVSSNVIEAIQRPKPPSDIGPEHAIEWTAIVNRMPAEWFPRETHAMLAQYCRHVVTARKIDQLIQQFMMSSGESIDIDKYDQLLKMQEREGRAMSSLGTRLRITQQSTFDKEKKKGKQIDKPWSG